MPLDIQAGIDFGDELKKLRDNDCEKINLSTPGFERHMLTREDYTKLAEALAENTSLKELLINNQKMDDAAMAALAPALAAHPALQSLTLGGNAFTEKGLEVLVDAIAGHQTLTELSLNGTPMNSNGFRTCTRLLENPAFASLAFGADITPNDFEDGLAAMSDAACATKSPNLVTLWPVRGNEAKTLVERNETMATKIRDGLKKTPVADWPEPLLHAAELRRTAIRSVENGEFKRPIKALDSALDGLTALAKLSPLAELPVIDADSPDLTALVKSDAKGYTPLDNPETWENFAKIAEKLKAQGTPISREHLLQPNKDGLSFLAVGIWAGHGDTIRDFFEKSGEEPGLKDLLATNHSAFDATIKMEGAASVFTEERIGCEPLDAVKFAYRLLSEKEQADVPNIHSLLTYATRAAAKNTPHER